MKNKIFTSVVCSLLVCLLLVCMTGCDGGESSQSGVVDEKTVTIVSPQNGGTDLAEGQFNVSGQNGNKASNAKKLGGSATLEIEFSDDETQPGEGENTVTEPQWQPGIW